MPNPTPSLETGWGKSAAAGSVATAPGEGARPCLRHSVPTGPCAPPWVPSGSWRKKNYLGVRPSRKPKGSEHAQPHVPPSLSPRPSIGSARGARRRTRRSTSEDHSIGPTEGGSPGSGSGRQGNRPESIYTTGGGAAPGVSPPPRRPYKGTGRGGASFIPGPGARNREPGYLPGPRARPGPRMASPDQPRRRPRCPDSRLARPHPAALGPRSARPAQPGRSPPARGPGSDFAPGPTGCGGAGQCL